MLQNLVVGSVCVAFFSYFQALGDVVFVQKPQNLTIFNLKEPFFFNCSTDIASNDGMDWVVRIKGIYERICSSAKFYLTGDNSCLLNYSMEVPNNRTLNLIVDPRIALLGDEYCCQFDNGGGNQSCSYLTISLATDPAVTDITTVFPYKTITAAVVVPAVIVSVVAVVIFFIWKNRRANCRINVSGPDANNKKAEVPLTSQSA